MKQRVYNILMLLLIGGLYGLYYIDYQEEHKEPEKVDVLRLEQPYFLSEELNDSILLLACEYYRIKYPKIVVSQAILESGWFKSKVFKEYNNPFGLYNSKKADYYKFNHWSEAILAYKSMIEYKHKDGEDYYDFLQRIGYAQDSLYIPKIKRIVELIPP